jgi:hypothetical protein
MHRAGNLVAHQGQLDASREAIAATAPERVLQAQALLRNELLARPDPAF